MDHSALFDSFTSYRLHKPGRVFDVIILQTTPFDVVSCVIFNEVKVTSLGQPAQSWHRLVVIR